MHDVSHDRSLTVFVRLTPPAQHSNSVGLPVLHGCACGNIDSGRVKAAPAELERRLLDILHAEQDLKHVGVDRLSGGCRTGRGAPAGGTALSPLSVPGRRQHSVQLRRAFHGEFCKRRHVLASGRTDPAHQSLLDIALTRYLSADTRSPGSMAVSHPIPSLIVRACALELDDRQQMHVTEDQHLSVEGPLPVHRPLEGPSV